MQHMHQNSSLTVIALIVVALIVVAPYLFSVMYLPQCRCPHCPSASSSPIGTSGHAPLQQGQLVLDADLFEAKKKAARKTSRIANKRPQFFFKKWDNIRLVGRKHFERLQRKR